MPVVSDILGRESIKGIYIVYMKSLSNEWGTFIPTSIYLHIVENTDLT